MPKIRIIKAGKTKSKKNRLTKMKRLPSSVSLDAAVEAAREEEREKLSGAINDLEKQVARLRKKARGSNSRSQEDIFREAVEVAKMELRKSTGKLKKKLGALEADQLSAKLSKLRKRIIAEYEEQIIPALVQGDDEESLRESAEASHKTWIKTVRGVGLEFEEEESDDDDEIENEIDDDDEDDDDEEDDDEEEDRRPRLKKFKNNAGMSSARSAARLQSVPQSRLPVRMPNPAARNVGRHRNSSLASLQGVKSMSLPDYRDSRAAIMEVVRRKVASGGGFTTV